MALSRNERKVSRRVSKACPCCAASMAVKRMKCDHCRVSIDAKFDTPPLASLPVEHQRFIEMFILAGGNRKDMAVHVGVSYPTLRSRLDKVIESLRVAMVKTRPVKTACGGNAGGAAHVAAPN